MGHRGELWQEFDAKYERIMNGGRSPELGNPHAGEPTFVAVATVWLFRKTKDGIEVLFQQRSENVDRHPLDYDVSAGGHINYGESLVDAAIRETREEIGVEIEPSMLHFIFSTPSLSANNIINGFLCDYTGKKDEFHFNDNEVKQVKWVPLKNFDEFIMKYAKQPLKKDTETRSLIKKRLEFYENNNS